MAISAVPASRIFVRADSSDPDSDSISADVRIGRTNFPDANFRKYVSDNFDKNKNGSLSDEEVKAVTKIEVYDKNIKNLKGLSYFTNLTYLDIGNNPIKSVDLTKLTKLTDFYCYTCELTSLNLSKNPDLERLACGANHLTELDLSVCPKLEWVDCGMNELEEIDISSLTNLTQFWCETNYLEELDVSKNTKLVELFCRENNLTKLDVSMCKDLEDLRCSDNQLSSLNLKGCTKLSYIEASKNKLTSLDLSSCTLLTDLRVQSNSLASLDVSMCQDLTTLSCQSNKLTSLKIGKKTELTSLSCQSNLLTCLDVSGCSALTSIGCFENELVWVDVTGCESLEELSTFANPLTRLDVSSCPNLNNLLIYATDIKSVNLGNCPILTDLIGRATRQKSAYLDYDFYYYYDSTTKYYYAFDEDTATVITDPVTYTITFDANGGTGSMASLTIAEDGILTLPENGFTAPEGMKFEKWNLGNPGDKMFVNSAFTVKAMWVVDPLAPTKEPVSPDPEKEPSFEDFVERLYTIALGRASETEGKEYWVEQVVENGFSGADCARFFLLGAPEFLNRELTDEEFVEILYLTFFDRASEQEGKEYWLGRLASGSTRADLVNEFIESTEWCDVCATYGVKSGALYHTATKPSKNAIKFATRLYTCCLGRDPEEDGLQYWSMALTKLEVSGYQAASLFFTLPEFQGFNTTNEEFLRRLYTTFMGRDPEEDGYNYWLALLNGGMDRNEVLKGFAASPEFQKICNRYGIERGEI